MHATETVRPGIVSPRCLALGYTMFAHVKFESALVGLVCIAVGCMNGRASAVTAEVARKCAALTAKAYPPQVPGNPAAGLAKGTVQSKRDYFNKCVANGGNMDDDAPEHPPLPPIRNGLAGDFMSWRSRACRGGGGRPLGAAENAAASLAGPGLDCGCGICREVWSAATKQP